MATLAFTSANASGASLLQLSRMLAAVAAEQKGDNALDGTVTITDSPLTVAVTGRSNANANVTLKP